MDLAYPKEMASTSRKPAMMLSDMSSYKDKVRENKERSDH